MKASVFTLICLTLAGSRAFADSGSFETYCDQLSTAAPLESARPNSMVSPLRAVIDATNQTKRRMQTAIDQLKTYAEFKSEAAQAGLVLSDSVHQIAYASLAKLKCDSLNEAGVGQISNQAFTGFTKAQDLRRANDVDPRGAQEETNTGTTGESNSTK